MEEASVCYFKLIVFLLVRMKVNTLIHIKKTTNIFFCLVAANFGMTRPILMAFSLAKS